MRFSRTCVVRTCFFARFVSRAASFASRPAEPAACVARLASLPELLVAQMMLPIATKAATAANSTASLLLLVKCHHQSYDCHDCAHQPK